MVLRLFGGFDSWLFGSLDWSWLWTLPGASYWGEALLVLGQAGHEITRGPGGYLSWLKLALIWVLLISWVAFLEWVNKDTQKHNLQHFVWNPVIFFPFFVCFLLVFLLPMFAVGGTLLGLSLFVPAIVYIVQRNSQVDPHLKVLTPDHLWYVTATLLNRMGMKVRVEKRALHEKGPPVTFVAMGGANEQENQSNLIRCRQSEGYVFVKELFADALSRRADKVSLDYEGEKVTVRYQIDGVWHESEPQEKEHGELLLTVLKLLANLKPDQRRIRQEGVFRCDFEGKKIMTRIVTQGTKTGERVLWHLVRPVEGLRTLADLGMREKMAEQLKEIMRSKEGIVLFCSLPSGGLSTGITAALRTTDRFLNDFTSIYAKGEDELPIENVSVEHYNPAEGQKPDRTLLSIMRKDPDAIVMPEIPDVETANMMCQAVKNGKLIVTSIRAKEAIEALLRILLLKVPAEDFAPAVKAVLNQRLARKLCESCKQAYKPSPEMLKKLGLPVGRVEAFYKPPERSDDPKEEVCKACDGIGYFGRTGIFELLVVDKAIEDALIKQPKLEVLRAIAKANKHRGLQEEGVLLVARGITSLAELQRVLKA